MTPRVLIAGAGLGGLTAGLALLDRGIEVEIFEQAPSLKEVGAGVQISPNGTRVLFQLGLEKPIMAACYQPPRQEFRLWSSGERWESPVTAQSLVELYGAPHVTMHRADLQSILADAVRARSPNAIRVGAPCVGFDEGEAEVRLKLEGGREEVGDVLVGADGIHSTVRAQLFGRSQAQFTGGVAWRGVVPIGRLGKLPRPTTWLGPKGHVVVYPIRRGELVNIVAHVERNDWQVESWTAVGTTAEILVDFHGWHDEVRTLLANIEIPYKWAMFAHSTLPRWSTGRVTLLGDACHAMLPYLGSGANMAIEDAFVLARCIGDARHDVPAALARYEKARLPRTTEIVNRSAANRDVYHHSALWNPATAEAYLANIWEIQMGNRRWLYSYDALSVPV
jgi:salicylate hydroxylase